MSEGGVCGRCGAELSNGAGGVCSACREALADAPTVKESAIFPAAGPGRLESQPRSTFGDYEIICEIAQGGMGVVYKARQKSLNRIVALKMVRSDHLARENDIKRFRTEAQAAARLQHPNIVAIHEIGEVAGQQFYSMDYVEGLSLSQLARERTLTPREAASYVKVVAEAIQYAHQAGILHRDLKPSNVLVDANNQPRVADFGLAKLMSVDSELTLSGVVMGTPSYMPPEQATGQTDRIDARSDIYSLGAILYDLLCGRPPFRADTAVETLKQVVEMEPVAPRLLNPRIPRDLETICTKCLEKNAGDRYPSAAAVADELERFLNDLPIAARPISRSERLVRWSKRKPASATALGLLIIIAIGSPLAAFFINRARRAAEHSRAVAEANLYVAEMNLALEDIEADHRARAITLLNKHIPRHGGEDRRSFEWRYIWRQARGDYAFRLGFHNEAVRQVMFSPDNNLLASRSIDGTVTVWDTKARRARFTLEGIVSIGGYSEDGSSMRLGAEDGDVIAVDTSTGRRATFLKGAGILVPMAGSKTIATTSTNFIFRLWDCRTGKELAMLPGAGGGDAGRGARWALSVAISSNGAIVASIDKTDPQLEKRLVRVWDAASGRELARSTPAATAIVALQLSPDGRQVAYAVEDTLHLWDWHTSSNSVAAKAHNTAVRTIAFSSDSRMVATGASDQFIRIWKAPNGELLQVRKGHENSVRALAFSDDGRWLASGGLNEDVRIWDLRRPVEADSIEVTAAPELTKDSPRELLFSPDSTAVAFVSASNTAMVLDALSLQTVGVRAHVVGLPAFASAANALLTVASDGSAIQLWNPHHNTATEWFGSISGCVGVSTDLRMVAAAKKGEPLRLWQMASKQETFLPAPRRGALAHLTFSPDAKMLGACDENHQVYLWHVSAGTIAAVFTEHSDDVNHIAFSRDGRLLATASSDKSVILWNVATGKKHAVLTGHRHAIYAVAFSPDGKLLATGSLDNTVKLWNLDLLQEVGRFNTSTSNEILSENGVFMVAFSPDGNTLAARLRDGGLRVWRAASWEQIRNEMLAEAKP